jgi:hypothetical protein
MCRRLEACVESPAAAQIKVSTVHKAKGFEWPRVLMSSDFHHLDLIGAAPEHLSGAPAASENSLMRATSIFFQYASNPVRPPDRQLKLTPNFAARSPAARLRELCQST